MSVTVPERGADTTTDRRARGVERRARRRTVYRSRSVAVGIALVVLAVVAVWIGTECVLRAIGTGPLLASPDTIADTVLAPTAATRPAVTAGAVALAVVGIVLLVLALTPGRRHRTPVEHARGAVVVDAAIVASTAVHAARSAARLPDGHVSASVRGRTTAVRVVPLSGVAADEATIRQAVQERLASLDERFARRVRVRVEQTGRLT